MPAYFLLLILLSVNELGDESKDWGKFKAFMEKEGKIGVIVGGSVKMATQCAASVKKTNSTLVIIRKRGQPDLSGALELLLLEQS